MRKKGIFIVFEGIDGSGKTSQLTATSEYLQTHGRDVVVTREPGGTLISEKIRQLLLDPTLHAMDDRCELLLYGAARAQHLAEVIVPALDSGKIVLSDRFQLSTVAYQGYGRGIDLCTINMLNSIAAAGVTPELTVVLDVPADLGLKRVRENRGQPEDRLEQEKQAFFQKVRNGYLQEAAAAPDKIAVVDASLPKEAVFAAIVGVLEPLL